MTNPVSSQGLVERLRSLYIMDEVGSDNPLGRDAADALEAQSGRIASLEAALTEVRRLINEEYAHAKRREDEERHCRYREGIAEGVCDIMNAVNPVIVAALNPPPSGDS